jgi:hypothetical protein
MIAIWSHIEERMAGQPELVKVLLADEDGNVERLWATPLDQDRYQLENSPFYAYGVSWRDIIEARPNAPDEWPSFVRVIEKSGHRTIRIILDPPADQSPESQNILDTVVGMGCRYEGAHPGYLAIDIPPEADFAVVYTYLTKTGQRWEHADPRYSDLYPDEEA